MIFFCFVVMHESKCKKSKEKGSPEKKKNKKSPEKQMKQMLHVGPQME